MIKAPGKNLYELIVIIKSNLSEADIEKNIEQVEAAIKNYGGSIVRIDKPYRNRFTHKIKGHKDGYYVSMVFNSPPELPNLLKRTLSISDDVLRHIIVTKEK